MSIRFETISPSEPYSNNPPSEVTAHTALPAFNSLRIRLKHRGSDHSYSNGSSATLSPSKGAPGPRKPSTARAPNAAPNRHLSTVALLDRQVSRAANGEDAVRCDLDAYPGTCAFRSALNGRNGSGEGSRPSSVHRAFVLSVCVPPGFRQQRQSRSSSKSVPK